MALQNPDERGDNSPYTALFERLKGVVGTCRLKPARRRQCRWDGISV